MGKDKIQIMISDDPGKDLLPGNLVSVIEHHAVRTPDKTVYIFLEDGENEKERVTCSGISERSRAVGASLRDLGAIGDRVLLLFPTGIDFILALYGCFYAGMIAVPAYPPRKNRLNRRFGAILDNARPSVILTNRKIKADLETLSGEVPGLGGTVMLAVEDVPDVMSELWSDPGLRGSDLAMIQYTSGSTGDPNGVVLTHANIIHNSECIKRSFGFDEHLVGVNWLPNFHDMGLIGCLIQPAYLGASNVIIPPMKFLQDPLCWLRNITKYRATNAGGPNFAYEYCIARINDTEVEQLDLSSVTTMFCGSEPVRKETLTAFARKFGSASFIERQFYPCYGLAESVLIATGGDHRREPVYLSLDVRALEDGKVVRSGGAPARVLTGCGFPWLGMSVAIVDPERKKPADTDRIGEIWLKGPSVAGGYWNDSKRTSEMFKAYLEGADDGPWLRTGDLGFIHDGQLYITGRLKDLIIIRGSNFFAADIEFSAGNCHEALRHDACAAFSAEVGHEEQVVIVQEVERTAMRSLDEEEVFAAIRNAVVGEHGIQPYAIVLVSPGSLLKTTSGKVRRQAMRQAWIKRELKVVASRELAPEITNIAPMVGFRPGYLHEWLINWIAGQMNIAPENIDPDRPLSSYGLDSIMAVSLERDVNTHFGVEWPIESFLKDSSVNQLVEEGKALLRS